MGGIISPQSKKIKREGTRHHPEEVITEEILPQSKKIKREGTRHLPEEVITEEILPQSKKIKREGTRHLPEEVITEEILPQSKKIKREGTRHLPEEIITEEILPRLPVKTLLKFRCVTKSWCSLIESKRFVKAHLENSIKSSRSAHDPILKFYIADEVYVPSLFETDRKSFNADFGIDSDLEIYVVGCCNGLVCLLLVKKRFILWNPATRKFHNLRDFPNNTESPNIVFYGFGFDELNDDYKVFALVWDSYSDDIYSIVYCLRSNLWKVIEKTGDFISSDDDSVTPQDFAGLCVNGKLHWYKYASEIISFDLNSYVDGVVQLPIHPMECCVRLGVVEGCLSAHYFHKENFVLDVWILKEYGVKESWGKVATIPCYKFSKGLAIPSPSPSPIAIDPNGDIFLTWGYGIVIYSTKSDDRYSNMTNGDLFREMSIYIESLASVAPDDEQES